MPANTVYNRDWDKNADNIEEHGFEKKRIKRYGEKSGLIFKIMETE